MQNLKEQGMKRHSRLPLVWLFRTGAAGLVTSGLLTSGLMTSVLLTPCPALAQNYPEKTVRIVVPVAAAGNQDLVARGISQKLSEQMGQQFIVENRPSASAVVGTVQVAKAVPDGYTLLAISNTFAAAPATVLAANYDPVKDFTGITLTAALPLVLLAHPSLQLNTVKELIALAKKRPGQLTFGSAGAGSNSHLAMELFNLQADIKLTHVPYKGNAPALTDLVGGQIGLLPDTISTSLQFIRAGKAKALGVTSNRRASNLPEVPAINESGMSGYELVVFNAMMAPAGVPANILRRLHGEIAKAVLQPDLKDRFLQQGVDLVSSASPEECSSFIRNETAKYAKIVRAAGIQPE